MIGKISPLLRGGKPHKIRPMMLRRFFVAAIFVLSAFGAGCAGEAEAPASERLPATHWFDMKIGDQTIRMQLVVTRQEMMRGLMDRTELGENDGMLFAYQT